MCNIRLFLFHTALASGAPPAFPPFAVVEARGVESRRPLPDFATNLGFGVVEVEAVKAVGAVLEAAGPLSPTFDGTAAVEAFDAKNVLFTETALKEGTGFLRVEVVRAWPPLSSPIFEASAFVPSVSDPPLTLTSAELLLVTSRESESCLLPSLSAVAPSTERNLSEGTS